MRNKKILNSPRLMELKRKRRLLFLRKIAVIVFIIFAIIAFFTFLSRIEKFNIQKVEVTGNKVIESYLVKDLVNEKLVGKYLGLFPKTNFIIYPKASIKKSLEEAFPRFKDISIKVASLENLQISVSEREGVYIWCGENMSEDGREEECYFLDNTGFKFDRAPFFSNGVYLKFYGSLEYFNELVYLNNEMEIMGLNPEAVNSLPDGNMEIILLRNKSMTSAPRVLLNTDTDFKKAAENLQAAVSTEPLLSKLKNNYSSLEYIDLRYGNKVYYKFK